MKLTLPARDDPGSCLINVDGKMVGHVMQGYDSWTAYLWTHPGCWDSRVPRVTAPLLRDIRVALQERLAEKGPWWQA